MKSKILIFLFTILTMGLFLIPNTFAKSYNTNDMNYINRVDNIQYYDNENAIRLYVNYNYNNNGYYYFGLMCFDENGSLLNIHSQLNQEPRVYYSFVNNPTDEYRPMYFNNAIGSYYYFSNPYYGYALSGSSNFDYCFIYISFNSSSYYNLAKTFTFNVLSYRSSNNINGSNPFVPYYIPNVATGDLRDLGVFNSSSVQLRRSGSNSYTDISESCLFYNTFRFNQHYIDLINATNNVNANGNYYIRFYFNNKVKNLSNFNLSYLELMAMRGNNSLYSDITSIRNALSIISSNITLYNSNTTLFTTNDLINSGYGDFYLEYIDFRIADYSFKSSSYFNSGLGISGYLSATQISAMSVNSQVAYNNGFNDGSRVATEDAYNNGFNAGVASNRTSFDNMMLSVANVPMTIISSMLGFEVLGVNLLGFFMGIITLLLFVKLMKKFKE